MIWFIFLFAACSSQVEKISQSFLVRVVDGRKQVAYIHGTPEFGESHVRWLLHCGAIDKLKLKMVKVTRHQLATILQANEIKELNLAGTPLSRPMLDLIARERDLKFLVISDTGIQYNDLAPLLKCKNLRTLHVGSSVESIDIDVATLSKMESLNYLSVVGRDISAGEIRELGSLHRLSHLNLFLVRVPDGIYKTLTDKLPRTEIRVLGVRSGPFGWTPLHNPPGNKLRDKLKDPDAKPRAERPGG